MQLKVYSIFDAAVGVYLRPFLMRNRGEALRFFVDMCNDDKSVVCQHAADHTLFEIADYDDELGLFKSYDVLQNLGNALQYQTRGNISADLQQEVQVARSQAAIATTRKVAGLSG